MDLRARLAAGLRAMSEGWARDLCLLYGLQPGEELTVAVRRPVEAPDVVDVRVAAPPGRAQARAPAEAARRA